MTTTRGRQKIHDAQIALALARAANASSVTSFFAQLQKIGIFVVTDPVFAGGAKGDGIHNDTPAIQLAQAAASAAGGWLYFPPGVYLTMAPLVVVSERWIGVPGHSTIKAGASFVYVASFDGPKNVIYGMTFSASRPLCDWAGVRLSDVDSQYELCAFNDANLDGLRAAQATGPATISAVTQTGPGSTLSVSQLDPFLALFAGGNLVMKVSLGGGINTAEILLSFDGGATYSSSPQLIANPFQLGYPGGIAGNFLTATGLLVTPEVAGPFVLDTTYAFTVSVGTSSDNTARFTKCSADNCGSVYASAALAPSFPGPTFNTIVAPGTVTAVGGSSLVQGAGTNFLSMGLRDGSAFWIEGLLSPDGTPQRLMVSFVANDDQLYIDQFFPPSTNTAGAQFAATNGAGASEDPSTGSQNGSLFEQFVTTHCAQSVRAQSLGGPNFNGLRARDYAITAYTLGTAFSDASSTATIIQQPDWLDFGPVAGFLYVQAQTLGVTITEPTGTSLLLAPADLSGGGPTIIQQGGGVLGYGAFSDLPINALQFLPTQITLAAGTVLPAPSFKDGSTSSYIRVTSAGDIDWTGGIATPKPLQPGASPFGIMCSICNFGFTTINMVDATVGGTLFLSAPYVALGFLERANFMFEQFGWRLVSKGGIYRASGNNGPDPGSRTTFTTNNTPKMLYQFGAGNSFTPGSGCRFDVAAEKNDGLGTTAAWWFNGRVAWDGANVLRTSSIGDASGTAVGNLPPTGWTITFDEVAGFNRILVTGDNVNVVNWRIKIHSISAP